MDDDMALGVGTWNLSTFEPLLASSVIYYHTSMIPYSMN